MNKKNQIDKNFELRMDLMSILDWAKKGRKRYPAEFSIRLATFIQRVKEHGYQQGKKETEKAFGGCKKCYGKGYSTEHTGGATALPDFRGNKRKMVAPAEIRINYCSCGRGDQLEKLIKTLK